MAETETIESAAPVTETPASRSSDDPKIVDAIQEHLNAFNDLVEDGDTPAVPAETPAAEEKPEEGDETPPPNETEEPKPKTEEAAPALADSTLPAAYFRTAKARGWTDEEITQFHKANPDLSLKTFERMHESRTKEIQEWAELGRKNRPASSGGAPTAPPATTPSAPVQSAALKPINAAELIEKYGNEELVNALVGPINQAIEALAPIAQNVTREQERTQKTNQEALVKTVQDFFTDKNMAPYAEAYGKDFAALTTEQRDMRSKVLETADALLAGAAFQGRDLSIPDALMLAHDSVASGLKETIIRDKIRKDVSKRAKLVTLRPTAQGRKDAGGLPRDRQELLSRTEDRLAAAFSA